MKDKTFISADGVEIVVGTRVVHFMDEWKDASAAMFLDADNKRHVRVHFRSKYGGICAYQPDLLYATETGLLGERIKNAKEQADRYRTLALEQDHIVSESNERLLELHNQAKAVSA